MEITLATIEQARRAVSGAILRTPLLPAPRLSALTGADVFIKYENLQVTGSFKERGALAKLATLPAAARGKGVIAMSAGNHAQAVAYHAGRLKIPATIVMPAATPLVKVAATERHGAEVVLEGETLADCETRAENIAAERHLTWVHPYDDAQVMAGQGTIALEMLEEMPELEVLVLPIGGGGLIAGNAVAAKAVKPGIAVIGVEAALYPSMWNAIKGDRRPIAGLGAAGVRAGGRRPALGPRPGPATQAGGRSLQGAGQAVRQCPAGLAVVWREGRAGAGPGGQLPDRPRGEP